MSTHDERPAVWVGHVSLRVRSIAETSELMQQLGMRPIERHDELAIFELRGGTHLVLVRDERAEPELAPFDLMVDDLDATHARLRALGLEPSEIRDATFHRSFTVTEPSGHVIAFNSSHVSGRPV
jgi:catechol 2,3-dioxygenase-like lactoylglutathione lyase family enzyme